jgi:hypothetical protein
MGSKGGQDFGLLALWDLEEVQGSSEFRCNLIELSVGLSPSASCLKSGMDPSSFGATDRDYQLF